MSKLIIIEGSDNTGKSTQASLLIKKLKDIVFQKLHYSSLPFKDDTDLHITYSTRMYDDMFKLMTLMKDNHINAIFDRSHLGETVYSPLYRQYSGDYVFDIEKNYVNELSKELYLITLVNDPNIIFKRDDGLSFYKNEEGVKAEVDGFIRAHRLSKIKNKLLVNVGTMSADEVCEVILNFIKEER
jgi:hypothetical protein